MGLVGGYRRYKLNRTPLAVNVRKTAERVFGQTSFAVNMRKAARRVVATSCFLRVGRQQDVWWLALSANGCEEDGEENINPTNHVLSLS
ncbi:hypothetical protein N7472_004994 [Penicillium cf. griseofulvum]|uniref:Uncharacterized protein n=1 Tax=Penicillium cf. griseofulvum TaxID=2972120 RepID=A0A9W9JMS3_9EURO|nr:hypothetical protein N7472_004994 [Penicillium cf. griseofulvum]